jgi:hypothetical protein
VADGLIRSAETPNMAQPAVGTVVSGVLTAAAGDQLLARLILMIDQAVIRPGPEVPRVRPHGKDAPVGWAGASSSSACR